MILTTTTGGLDAPAIEPFFYSLRLSGCKDPVIVFASKTSDACRVLCEKYGATVVDFDYRGMPILQSRTERLKWYAKTLFTYYRGHRWTEKDVRHMIINCSRFFFYRDYLLGLKEKPSFVLLSDLRDVVFQRDPFSYPFKPGLSVTTECKKIIQTSAGVKHLVETVGVLEMSRIARRDIVNVGTSVADFDTMMKYLDLLTSYFNRSFFWALIEGVDQAIHTYIVHNRLVDPIHYFNNWKGPFLTLADEVVLPRNKNKDGLLCNDDGSVIPIVHQYDRVKGLYDKVGARPECWKLYWSQF